MSSISYDGNIKAFSTYLKSLAGSVIKQTDDKARWQMSKTLATTIKQRYRSYNTPISGLHADIRRLGKRAGAGPAKPPRDTKPVTEHLAQSITSWKEGAKYVAGIPQKALYEGVNSRYRRGVPMRLLSTWIEDPWPQVIPITTRMAGYLAVMKRRQKGFGSKSKTGASPMPSRIIGAMVLTPKDRPVWRHIVKDLKVATKYYDMQMAVGMAKAARATGGIVRNI